METAVQTDEPAFSVTAVIGSDDTAIITITGDIDATTLPLLSAQLQQILAARPRPLVFDLSNVGFLDCAAAESIVHPYPWPPAGPKPVLRDPAPGVLRLLDITGFSGQCVIESVTGGQH
jgi:anti-anti-sigma factor